MIIFILALILCTLFWIISFLRNKRINFKNKFYSFECGFNPFTSPQSFFSIQFFKILIIFLLFDIEIIIIIPIPLYHPITFINYTFYILIIRIIILGLIFEWKEGSLEWLK